MEAMRYRGRKGQRQGDMEARGYRGRKGQRQGDMEVGKYRGWEVQRKEKIELGRYQGREIWRQGRDRGMEQLRSGIIGAGRYTVEPNLIADSDCLTADEKSLLLFNQNYNHYSCQRSCLPICGVAIVRLLSCLFLEEFEGNAHIYVAIGSGFTVAVGRYGGRDIDIGMMEGGIIIQRQGDMKTGRYGGREQ